SLVGWAKARSNRTPSPIAQRSAVPTRLGPKRVGTALQCAGGKGGARGPRLCPPYKSLRSIRVGTGRGVGVRSRGLEAVAGTLVQAVGDSVAEGIEPARLVDAGRRGLVQRPVDDRRLRRRRQRRRDAVLQIGRRRLKLRHGRKRR